MDNRNKGMTDNEGFLEVVDRHSGIIAKICYYYATDADDFQDLRQDVLANMWSCRDSFRGDSSLSTWIYRVAINTCISAFRHRKHKGEQVGIEFIPELADDSSENEHMHAEMHRLISCLNKEEKAAILMWLDGLSYDEIAAIIGCKRNTVAVRLKRIKDKIVKMSNC